MLKNLLLSQNNPENIIFEWFWPFYGLSTIINTRIKTKYCLQMYHRIIISNFLKTWSLFLNFFHFFIIFSVFRILVISRPFVDPPDPWGTQTFWLWSWIYPRSPWDVSQLQKTASWQLFSMSIVQKPWYGHFHYFGAFWGPLGGRALISLTIKTW